MVALIVSLLFLQERLGGNPLVTYQEGSLPLLICAPHGGELRIGGVEQRTGVRAGVSVKNFVVVEDLATDLLALEVADDIQKLSGRRPFLVVAHFSRKYVDANRPPDQAYESIQAKPTYDLYHRLIFNARQDILDKWHAGLLIDVHGQGRKRDTIIRGTANLKTVTHLVSTYGLQSLTGPSGLLGVLADHGAIISPSNVQTGAPEEPSLDGGWTVRHYGSTESGSFDALQLEFGLNYRKQNRHKTAQDLAVGLLAFANQYLLTSSRNH